jgi:mannose-1-phosphate guanylyltransferase
MAGSEISVIRQAVILCAGLGSRLRPFTDSAPKPMLPLLGVPLIERNIVHFREYGVTQFFINLHYLPHVLRNHLGDGSRLGVRIEYHFEPELLGTAGGAKSFNDQLDEEFFLLYGDIFSRINYRAMELAFRQKINALGIQTMIETAEYADADVAELDADDCVVAVHPKPHTAQYSNAYRMRGVFILRRDILSEVPADKYFEIGRDLLPAVVAKGRTFYGYNCDGYSKGIDTLAKWKEVESYLAANGLSNVLPDTD